jgi:transcription elongation GreA/GreB family factor
MDKRRIIDGIIAQLQAELELFTAASRGAREDATDDQARSEDKYDTRATEASYLADGQAKVAAEVLESLEVYQKMQVRSFSPGSLVELGALVQVEQPGTKDWFFLGPRSGGLVVKEDGREVAVITPHSPMGRGILGHAAGNTVEVNLGGAKREAKIVSVE